MILCFEGPAKVVLDPLSCPRLRMTVEGLMNEF